MNIGTKFSDGLYDYELLCGTEVGRAEGEVEFADAYFARGFLDRFLDDTFVMSMFREVVYEEAYSYCEQLSDNEVLAELSHLLADGRVRIREQRQKSQDPLTRPAPQEPPARDLEEEKPSAWIEIELLDQLDRPIPRQRYLVRRKGGSILAEGTLNQQGRARIQDLQPGAFEVQFPELEEKKVSKA